MFGSVATAIKLSMLMDPPAGASVERPMGNKKAKAKRSGRASSALVEASVNKIIAEVTSNSKDQKSDTRWSFFMDKVEKRSSLRWQEFAAKI
jgi:hypothetical protein